MAAEHGYVRYTRGCRCQVCRAAKATYVRAKRASAREKRLWVALFGDGGRYVATGITHGYAGYQDYSCRCEVCTAARSKHDKSRKRVSV